MTRAEDALRAELEERLWFEALQRYPWPGNIRELRNVIERAVILSDSSTLQVPHDAAKLKAGESILIPATSGGVGSFAVQFAKIAGAKVIGLASRKNQAYLKELGATDTVDYASGDLRAAVKALVRGARTTRAGRSSSRCSAWRGPSVEA